MLYVYNEYFELIAFGDSGGTGASARIEITVRSNHIYYFKVVGWFDSSGEYGITLREE